MQLYPIWQCSSPPIVHPIKESNSYHFNQDRLIQVAELRNLEGWWEQQTTSGKLLPRIVPRPRVLLLLISFSTYVFVTHKDAKQREVCLYRETFFYRRKTEEILPTSRNFFSPCDWALLIQSEDNRKFFLYAWNIVDSFYGGL